MLSDDYMPENVLNISLQLNISETGSSYYPDFIDEKK